MRTTASIRLPTGVQLVHGTPVQAKTHDNQGPGLVKIVKTTGAGSYVEVELEIDLTLQLELGPAGVQVSLGKDMPGAPDRM